MNRIVTVHFVRTITLLACAGWLCFAPAAAEAQLADVTSVDKIEIRAVNSSTGVANIQVEFNLMGTANASVVEVVLRDFSLDNVMLLPQPNTNTFELKNHQPLLKQLMFTTPITPQMAPLMSKWGKHVRVSGTLKLTAQPHGALFGKKPSSAESVFGSDALMVTPDEQVRASITRLPYFGAVAGVDGAAVKPALSADQGSETWMTDMRRRASGNVVIIEASADAGLGLVKSKLYRQGYRISDHEVIAPLDLADPVAAQPHKDEGVIGNAVANVSRRLNTGEVQYRAWLGASAGAAPDRVSFDLPTSSLRLKCSLSLDNGTHPGLGLFELGGFDKSQWESIDVDGAAGKSISAMQLAYSGLSENQPFTSAVLLWTPVSGSVSGAALTVTPRVSASVYGTPLFTRRGLAGIVNGPDSAVYAPELKRALLSQACMNPAPAAPAGPVATASAALFKVKVVSNPESSLVWIDHKLAYDASMHPIMTAPSKDACSSANTILVPPGQHYISFLHEGYKDFSGYVNVDADMTLTAILVRQR